MADSVHIKIVVKVGDETMLLEHRSPLYLGGDRRRWRRRIVEHVTGQAEFLATRFSVKEPAEAKQTA